MNQNFDLVIIGSGILGLSCARSFLERNPRSSVLVIDKEPIHSAHASTRNSGILHAGFYYSENSLKARFCQQGNQSMKAFCHAHAIPVDECGKIIVARNRSELISLEQLYIQAATNKIPLEWVSESELGDIEPLAKTYEKALFSPTTAVVDPKLVCSAMVDKLRRTGCTFELGLEAKEIRKNFILSSKGKIFFKRLINVAGLQADRLFSDSTGSKRYVMVPFKGLYLGSNNTPQNLRRNIYPVPHAGNAFLGVHLSRSSSVKIKIGPSAFPAFWRENYKGLQGLNFAELVELLPFYTKAFFLNWFNFRSLAFSEWKKALITELMNEARSLVKDLDGDFFWMNAGVRAQLFDLHTKELVNDFLIEKQDRILHVLNSVSPGFTCAIPFGDYLASMLDKVDNTTVLPNSL